MAGPAASLAPPRLGFFAIDARIIPTITALGMNPAVAYVVLASGTGRTPRSWDKAGTYKTFWSVHAIEKYTGISRHRARAAIDALLAKGLITAICVGGRSGFQLNRPIVPDPRPELDWSQREVLERVRRGQRPRKWEAEAVQFAIDRGWLVRGSDERLSVAPPPPVLPCWIWLPNAIVTGVADETPPLERVRQTQDAMTLRLFLELYGEGHPRADGGIRHSLVYRAFERKQIGQSGALTIWGFQAGKIYLRWSAQLSATARQASTEGGTSLAGSINSLTPV